MTTGAVMESVATELASGVNPQQGLNSEKKLCRYLRSAYYVILPFVL